VINICQGPDMFTPMSKGRLTRVVLYNYEINYFFRWKMW